MNECEINYCQECFDKLEPIFEMLVLEEEGNGEAVVPLFKFILKNKILCEDCEHLPKNFLENWPEFLKILKEIEKSNEKHGTYYHIREIKDMDFECDIDFSSEKEREDFFDEIEALSCDLDETIYRVFDAFPFNDENSYEI